MNQPNVKNAYGLASAVSLKIKLDTYAANQN
jgi:hypothetical protein